MFWCDALFVSCCTVCYIVTLILCCGASQAFRVLRLLYTWRGVSHPSIPLQDSVLGCDSMYLNHLFVLIYLFFPPILIFLVLLMPSSRTSEASIWERSGNDFYPRSFSPFYSSRFSSYMLIRFYVSSIWIVPHLISSYLFSSTWSWFGKRKTCFNCPQLLSIW